MHSGRIKLTEAEQAMIRRLQARARLWLRFRWAAFTAGLVCLLGGAFNLLVAVQKGSPDSPARLTAIMGSWTLLMLGLIVLIYVQLEWKSAVRDQLLLRLLDQAGGCGAEEEPELRSPTPEPHATNQQESRAKAAWAEVRRKGQLKYVFLRCLPRWGIVMAAAIFAGSYLAEFGRRFDLLWSAVAQRLMVRSAIVGAIFALVMGAWSWNWKERAYSASEGGREIEKPES